MNKQRKRIKLLSYRSYYRGYIDSELRRLFHILSEREDVLYSVRNPGGCHHEKDNHQGT
jgi:hypothetical protein